MLPGVFWDDHRQRNALYKQALCSGRSPGGTKLISGKVKFYNSERGFGYVQQTRNQEQIRVSGSALARAGIKRLSEGQRVTFDTHIDPQSGRQVVDTIEISRDQDEA